VVITEAGNDPKVVGLVYVAALAPADGKSVASISKPYPPTPLGAEIHADPDGFLTLTPKGIAEDLAEDLTDKEKQLLPATQGPTAAAVFGATVTTAAWNEENIRRWKRPYSRTNGPRSRSHGERLSS
jgi:hypothetical protein